MKIDFFKRFRDQFTSFKSFNLFDTQARRLISSGHFENPENIKKPEKHDNIPPAHKLKSLLFVTGIFPDILHGGGLRIYDFIFKFLKKLKKITPEKLNEIIKVKIKEIQEKFKDLI